MSRRRAESSPSGVKEKVLAVSVSGVRPVPDLPRWVVFASLILLLGLFAGLSGWEMAGDSVTSDERIHLPAGYAYWKAREFRLNPEHPPLVKLLSALPLLTLNLQMPSTQPDPGLNYNEYQQVFGTKFLFSQDADRILFRGRLPILGLGVLLAFFVFLWSWRLHGHPGAGILSLLLISLDPATLAHSHYVTMDVPLACFSVMAMFFLWQFSRNAKPGPLIGASLCMALALASKFSAVFLLPVFFLLLFFRFPVVSFGNRLGSRKNQVRIWSCLGAGLGIVLVVQACYFFSPDLWLYYKGAQQVNTNHNPSYLYFAAGKFFPGGVWWYPIYAFAIKTPLITLAAIVVAPFFFVRRRKKALKDLAFLLLPAGAVTVATCAFADNLGVRYMIPVTAFLVVLAGELFFFFAASWKRLVLAGALTFCLGFSVLRVSPHHLAYFNELAGGPKNAPNYLDDSNIDWGQDLKRLVEYLEKHRISNPILSFWGPGIPEYYGDRVGIHFSPWTRAMARSANPPAGVYALSVNNLVGIRRFIQLGEDPNLDWLRRYTPADRIGYSIYIYRFPENGR
jgi:hypothetical protein